MITCKLKHLVLRCHQRGYTLDEVSGCIVSQDGDNIVVDEMHPSYPRVPKQPPAPSDPPAAGPGTELKKILKDWLGITASPNCSCNARARQMDEWGPDECERRIPEITGWLEEQAKARGLPFVRFAAEQAIKLSIRRARKAAAKRP